MNNYIYQGIILEQNIKYIFIFGILFNFIFYLLRFILPNLGWCTIYNIFDIDMYKDYEFYYKWATNKISLTLCPYPFFIYFISYLKILPVPYEISISLSIFIPNMLIGYLLYLISNYYQYNSQKIIFVYYFNPITVFYFSMMLLNSCVYVLFVLIAFYLLLKHHTIISFIIGIYAFILKESAIIFLIFWSFKVLKKKSTLILLFIALMIILISLFIQLDNYALNYVKYRCLNTDFYSISLFPKGILTTILSLILIFVCIQKCFNLYFNDLYTFFLLCFTFDFFFPMGLVKYYLYLFIVLYILINEKHDSILFFLIFLIPRVLIHSILIIIIYLIYIKIKHEKI